MIRILFAVLILFSTWQASIILGAVTLLRVDAGPGESAARLALARTIDSDHPLVLRRLTSVSQRQVERLDSARALTKAEPFLGSAWADLFGQKLASSEFDDEMETALTRSLELSPYDPLVQEQLIRTGLGRWLSLTPAMKRMIVELGAAALANRASYRKDSRRALVRDSGLLPLVCQVSADSLCNNG